MDHGSHDRSTARSSRILVVVLVVLVGAALLTAPRRAPASTMAQSPPVTTAASVPETTVASLPYRTPFRRVLLLGDSITDQSSDTFHRRFDAEYLVTVSAVGGTRADQREADVPALATARPEQVIINLGSNDTIQATPADQTIASLTRIAAGFPSARCIALVTISENLLDFSRPELTGHTVDLNRRMRALAQEHGWRVIPWSDIVRDYEAGSQPDGPLTVDSLHPTAMGQGMLAEAYAQSLDTC